MLLRQTDRRSLPIAMLANLRLWGCGSKDVWRTDAQRGERAVSVPSDRELVMCECGHAKAAHEYIQNGEQPCRHIEPFAVDAFCACSDFRGVPV